MMDRIVAAAAGMAAAFYVMAAAVAWFRVVFPSPAPSLAARIMLDRAVAWSALSTIFGTVAGMKLSVWDWNDPFVGLVLALAFVAIFVAGLNSVRAFTMGRAFGNGVLAVFAVVSVAVGLLILLL